MTLDEIVEYYVNLLIIQYRDKIKARATIDLSVRPVLMDLLPLDVESAFGIDDAEGDQLDVLGKYAGVQRSNRDFSGPVILDDTNFRQLIKMKLIQNNSGSSLADIQGLIADYFPTTLRVFDFQNMRLGYYFDSSAGSLTLAEIFVREQMLPKPMGVQLASLIYITDLDNIFGFRTYSLPPVNVSGFNSYSEYEMDRPWLSYENALVY